MSSEENLLRQGNLVANSCRRARQSAAAGKKHKTRCMALCRISLVD